MTTVTQPDLAAAEEERRRALARVAEIYELFAQDGRDGPRMSYDERKPFIAEIEALQARYYELLPPVQLAVCPVCGKPLVQPFDPWGLDGFWWLETRVGPKPPPTACEHLRLLSGAVGLNGRPPKGSPFDAANPGPEVPYLIPALMQAAPSMTAVISSVPMRPGYTAYPIAYYSAEKPEGAPVLPWWTRTRATTRSGPGGFGWTIATQPWDFELRPWVEQERLRWIDPQDRTRALSRRAPSEFPFADLPGERMQQVIRDDRRQLLPPPRGQAVDPFTS